MGERVVSIEKWKAMGKKARLLAPQEENSA